jgi:hypothetical protein
MRPRRPPRHRLPPRGRPPDDPIGRRHRAPPITKVLFRAISLSCPTGRPWSSDTQMWEISHKSDTA